MRAALALLLSLTACQTLPAGGTATVDMSDAQTRAVVMSVLAGAMHRAQVTLGPTDAHTAVITVLPPPPGPLEGNSPALPVRFDIAQQNGRCVVVRHDTGEAFVLPGVACKVGE